MRGLDLVKMRVGRVEPPQASKVRLYVAKIGSSKAFGNRRRRRPDDGRCGPRRRADEHGRSAVHDEHRWQTGRARPGSREGSKADQDS